MSAAFRLHGYFRSSATYRVRIALNLKGLAYDYVPVNLKAGEQYGDAYMAVNPLSEVPTLDVLDPTGAVAARLAQSVAIIEYLEETHPEPALYGRDALERARIRQRVEAVNASIQPVQNLRVMKRVDELFGVGLSGFAAWGHYWIDRGFGGLEKLLAVTAGRYAVGDAVTAADVFLVPQVYNAHRFKVDMAKYPTIARVWEACEALQAFRAAHPARQPDTPEELRQP